MDLAAVATSAELQRVLEQSVRLNLFDRNALERYHGRRGMARLRRLIGGARRRGSADPQRARAPLS